MARAFDTSPASQGMLNGSDVRTFQMQMDVSIRHGFIRKVYGIVGSQLLLTALISGAIVEAGKSYLRQNQSLTLGLLLVSSMLSIGTMCIFCCAPHYMRKSPHNYAILLGFTVAEAIVVGMISSTYNTESVIIAFFMTTFLVAGLTVFACQTSYDFTGCGPYLFVGILCLWMFGFFVWLGSFFLSGPAFHTMNLLYATGGACLMGFYIIYDTQMIVGGKHSRSHEFSIDDYAFAAISLYMDIVQLFLYILRIVGSRRD